MTRAKRSEGCSESRHLARSRRDLLKAGMLAPLGVGLANLLRLEALAAGARRSPIKAVIFFEHYGAPSHIDTWDMKPDAPAEVRGEFAPIHTTAPGYVVCEHMPRIARLVDRMTIVRSMSHRVANHNPATYLALTGRTSTADVVQVGAAAGDWPNMGAVLSKLRPGDGRLPDSVILPHLTYDQVYTCPGQFGGMLGKQYDPFVIEQDPSRADFSVRELQLLGGISVSQFEDRRRLRAAIDSQQRHLEEHAPVRGMEQYHQRAVSLLTSHEAKRAFDVAQEPDDVRDRYGRNIVGQSLLLSRRLVEAGVRFVTCYHGLNPKDLEGWDTHAGNFVGLRDRLLPPEDQGFSALIEDLEERGLLDTTLVVWSGEFGRSPKVGKSATTARIAPDGRDHWPFCYSLVLAGGGVKRGFVCGASDKLGAYPASKPYSPADTAATIFWALGIDPATEIHDQFGRPFKLSEGTPAVEWFA